MVDQVDLFDTFVRAQIELWNAVDARVREDCGVPLGRIESLRALDARGGSARVIDIAADLVITVGAASKIVDRMAADGHVVRRPNPDDGRSSLVEIAFLGRILLTQGVTAMNAELAERFAQLGDPARSELLEALLDIREARRP